MNEIVLPGDEVGVVEEYVGEGFVYEYKGVLRAATVGLVRRDPSKHVLRVERCAKTPNIPTKGDIVYGVVNEVKPKIVVVDLVSMDKKVFQPPFTGLLPLSMITQGRIDSAENLFVESDIIVARVESQYSPFIITTKSPELGVILARCRNCGAMLEYDLKALVCPACGSKDRRKLSSNYILKKRGVVQRGVETGADNRKGTRR